MMTVMAKAHQKATAKQSVKQPAMDSKYVSQIEQLIASGQLSKALSMSQAWVQCAPNTVAPLLALSVTLGKLGRSAEAEDVCGQAVRLEWKNPQLLLNWAQIQLDKGRPLLAEAASRLLAAIYPDHEKALEKLALSLSAKEEWSDAGRLYEHLARKKNLQHLGYLRMWGKSAHRAGDAQMAQDVFGGIRVNGQPYSAIELDRWCALPIIYDNKAQLVNLRQRVESEVKRWSEQPGKIDLTDLIGNIGTFYFAYQNANDKNLMQNFAKGLRAACPELIYQSPHVAKWRHPVDRRVKIGFWSKFFKRHTIGRLNLRLIESLDRNKFEVWIFHSAPGVLDDISSRIEKAADHYIAVPEDRSLIKTRSILDAAELDVLYFADIGMDFSTTLVAHGRYAPLQIVGWGHPVTSGLPTIDDFLSSSQIETENAAEHYSERLVKLPVQPVTYPKIDWSKEELPSRDQFGFYPDEHLYVCPQTFFKLHPDFDSAVVQILEKDIYARVVFVNSHCAEWGQLFEKRLARLAGRHMTRVKILGKQGHKDFLGLMQAADVLLDPVYFGGGNTTFESLLLEKPIITWPGSFMRGRITAGLYRKIGLDSLIAQKGSEYVEKAIRIASDRSLQDNLSKHLFSSQSYIVENLEFIRIFEEYLNARLKNLKIQ